MRGVFLNKPFEFKLLINGETWNQGDSISGTLTVKNHASEAMNLDDTHVALTHGALKKVREKTSGAHKILLQQTFKSGMILAPQGEESLPFKFQTEVDAPITETKASLFVVCGKGPLDLPPGQLQLPVSPHPFIQEYLKVIQIEHRFVIKIQKYSSGWVELKMAPPDSKSYAAVEHLNLFLRLHEDGLQARFVFNVKKLKATAASIDSSKDKLEFDQAFKKEEYLTPYGRFNHDRINVAIKSIIDQLGIGVFTG